MNNYIEYNNKMAFHPGYYIQELVEDSVLPKKILPNAWIRHLRTLVF